MKHLDNCNNGPPTNITQVRYNQQHLLKYKNDPTLYVEWPLGSPNFLLHYY